MLWEFGVFLLTAANLAALWLVYDYPSKVFWILGIFALIALIGTRVIAKHLRLFLLLMLLALGAVLLLPLIDSPAQAKAFMVLASGIFYLVALAGYRLRKYAKDQTAKAMINLASLAVLFCWYASVFGWFLNIEISVWYVMAVLAVVTFLVSYVSIVSNGLGLNYHQNILYSVFLAYLISGTVWIQSTWPFGYLTTGVIALIIYYAGWDTVRNYFQGKLVSRKVAFNLIFLAGSVSVLLLSTKWYPIV
ncbi:MAG: hypothetical protein WC831_06110 [Parcubacteria group bacterium]